MQLALPSTGKVIPSHKALTSMEHEQLQHCSKQRSTEELLPFSQQIWRKVCSVSSRQGSTLYIM